tara:strand:+ start:181 stop:663 length:483 start_codon:yes stop_codon:yes gene_type:complete
MNEMTTVPIAVTINQTRYDVEVKAHHTLLEVLREQLHLTGTKRSCGEGECGACTVLVNGEAVNSCLVLAAEMDGAEILTIEGLERNGELSPLQQAFLDRGAVQCGFCTPGMVMAAEYLLRTTPHPTEAEIREGLSGNLCRCTGYEGIVEAVKHAGRETDS